MTVRARWHLAATIGLPLISTTAYLLWLWLWRWLSLWPRPHGTSVSAQVGPYLLCLATGLPFAWPLSRGAGRAWLLLGFLGGGFALLWIYALAVLCGVRGVCL